MEKLKKESSKYNWILRVKEIYRMLQIEDNVYLQPLPRVNHGYLSRIISGDKKVSMVINR